GADRRGGFAQCSAGELVELHTLDAQVHVDAIQDRAAETLLVARHHRFGAATRPRRIAVEAAWTWISGRDQGELGGKGECLSGTRNGDDAILDGLPEHFQDARVNLGNLVQ